MTRVRWMVVLLVAVGALAAASTMAWAQEAGVGGKAPTYFEQYFLDGGWVVWFIEFPMSIAMVALTIMYGLEVRRANQMPQASVESIRGMLETRQYREAIEYTAADRSMISFMVNTALREASRGYPAMERALEDAMEERTVKFMRKIEFLNVFGNMGPMIGLFGTVLGMIGAFSKMALMDVPDPKKMAGDISVALLTTLWGLFIAVPALTSFAILRNRLEVTAAEVAFRGQELLSIFNPAAPRGTPAAQVPTVSPPGRPAQVVVQPAQTTG